MRDFPSAACTFVSPYVAAAVFRGLKRSNTYIIIRRLMEGEHLHDSYVKLPSPALDNQAATPALRWSKTRKFHTRAATVYASSHVQTPVMPGRVCVRRPTAPH